MFAEANHAYSLIEENKRTQNPTLDLSNCEMDNIPQEITELGWLEELIIGNERFFDLKSNKYIFSYNTGRRNNFSKLPDELYKLKKLKKLVIVGNSEKQQFIENISDISSFKFLETLYLNNIYINDSHFISRLKNLKVLSISRCSLNDLSLNHLANLLQLQILRISDNKIENIGPLSRLINLTQLHLSNNHIHNLLPLNALTNIHTLIFNDNNVSDLKVLIQLKSLRKIHFDGNQVKEIKHLTEFESLEEFSCIKCPVEDCPTDVYESGDPIQLKAYFNAQNKAKFVFHDFIPDHDKYDDTKSRDLKGYKPHQFSGIPYDSPHLFYQDLKKSTSNLEETRDVKVVLLGNSNVGKTNLVNYLKTNNFTGERNSTHGLEVTRWIPDEDHFPELKNIAVSIWDFGGQEYYHGAYRLFLSANSVYILLWCEENNINGKSEVFINSSDAEKQEIENFKLYYWLDTVKFYSGGEKNVALITVQNKTDNPSENKVRISQHDHENYYIKDSYNISLKLGSSKKNVRQHSSLKHFITELSFLIAQNADNATIPSQWQKIRNEILKLKESSNESELKGNPFFLALNYDLWISIDDFENICNSILPTPLAKEEVHTLPRWLDRGGIVVYFPNILGLKDKIFLRPDLLAKTIYEVLDKDVHKKGGEFSENEILQSENKELKSVFLEIAHYLDLIFTHPVKGKGYYLAPQYLPDNHPIEDLFKIASNASWDSALWLKVPVFYYKKVLHGLLISFASDNSTECRYFWKHGILFIKQNLRVLIKGLYPVGGEADGVIMVGVEKDNQIQQNLTKEIFDEVLTILGSKRSATTSTVASPPNLNYLFGKLSYDIDLQVSYDGENFINYSELLENLEEAKVKSVVSNKWLITKKFASILPILPPKAKRVFLSYSHQNTYWLGRLRTHLAGLRRSKEIEAWVDEEILPGELWDSSIKKKLDEADIFIILLSADFIASDYIWDNELNSVFDNFKKRNARIIPILLEPLDLAGIPHIRSNDGSQSFNIKEFEILPKNQNGHLQPVSLWKNQEEALAKIAEKIRMTIKE